MKHIPAIFTCIGLLPATLLQAQEHKTDSALNRTVVVENQYHPEVMDAFKVNVLPKVEEPAAKQQHIDYATEAHPIATWQPEPMEAITRKQKQADNPRGYVRAAYGSRNNTDVKASYLWDITARDRLGIMASVYGMNGDFPSVSPEAPDWTSRFYRTDVSLDYRHRFRKVALSLGGAYASQVFGYMPGGGETTTGSPSSGRQHYTLGEGYIGISSVEGTLPVEFSVQTGLRTFVRKYSIPQLPALTENNIHTSGHIAGDIDGRQQVGIGFAMDNLLYGEPLKDYTLVQINPYYTFENDGVRLRAGAHVDGQTANGSGIKVAPDVKVSYAFGNTFLLYAHATGGTETNGFRHANETSPYWMQGSQLRTSYTPLNAQAGMEASPLAGLGFRLYGGYRIIKNELFALPGAGAKDGRWLYTFLAQGKAKTAYGGASFNYTWKGRLHLSLDGSYYGWDMEKDKEALLFLKPQYIIDASVRAKVFRELTLSAAYRHEGRVGTAGYPRPAAVSNLSLAAEYEFFHRLDVFVRFGNLLNRDYITSDGYPVQGFNAMAGASIRF